MFAWSLTGGRLLFPAILLIIKFSKQSKITVEGYGECENKIHFQDCSMKADNMLLSALETTCMIYHFGCLTVFSCLLFFFKGLSNSI